MLTSVGLQKGLGVTQRLEVEDRRNEPPLHLPRVTSTCHQPVADDHLESLVREPLLGEVGLHEYLLDELRAAYKESPCPLSRHSHREHVFHAAILFGDFFENLLQACGHR